MHTKKISIAITINILYFTAPKDLVPFEFGNNKNFLPLSPHFFNLIFNFKTINYEKMDFLICGRIVFNGSL